MENEPNAISSCIISITLSGDWYNLHLGSAGVVVVEDAGVVVVSECIFII
jgi:hypothetical protein